VALNETIVKSRLMERFHSMAGITAQRHEDKLSSGVPDISISHLQRTLWIEVKLDKGKGYVERDVQVAHILRLEQTGMAVYAIFDAVKNTITVIMPSAKRDGKPGITLPWDYSRAAFLLVKIIYDTVKGGMYAYPL